MLKETDKEGTQNLGGDIAESSTNDLANFD